MLTMFPDLDLNRITTAIVVLNSESQAVYLNQSAIQLFGVSPKHIQNDNFLELIRADFDQLTLTKLSQQGQSSFIEESSVRTATGMFQTNIMLSKLDESSGLFYLLEFQSSEHHANIRKDIELQQQSRVSNHLIRNLAHEIKNPLGGVKGAAQLLERKLPEGFSNRYTQIIIQEANRLSKLVDRLLLPAEPEPLKQSNIHKIIERALEIALLQNEETIEVCKDYDPSLPDLNIAPGQIQQALLNLIKNAIEAMEGKGKLKLKTRILLQHTIGKQQHKQVIRVDVIDDGPGVATNMTKDIFFPTISGKNSSGLGLSIAQSLVQRHSGIIEVESQPAETCFSIYLPLLQEKQNNG